MNNKRRAALSSVCTTLDSCKASLYSLTMGEQDALDNTPENLQDSDRARAAEDAIDELEEAYECIESAIDHINAAIS